MKQAQKTIDCRSICCNSIRPKFCTVDQTSGSMRRRLKLKKELDAAKKATSAGAGKTAEEEIESEQVSFSACSRSLRGSTCEVPSPAL